MPKHPYDYKFVIEGLKPDQIPVERLGQYLTQIARMLGIPNKMHLVDIEDGSAGLTFTIDKSFLPVAKKMEVKLREGTAPIRAKNAREKIAGMSEKDKTSAKLEGQDGAEIIKFPMRQKKVVADRIIQDNGTFTGRLHQIIYRGKGRAGDDTPAIVTLKTHRKEGMVKCHTNVAMARRMSDHLFKYVRVSGEGTWLFDRENLAWKLQKFVARDFIPLRDDETLTEFVDRVRGMTKEWPADLMDTIYELREDD